MDFLKQLHDLQIPPVLSLGILSTPLAFATFVLFLWSLGPAVKKEVRSGFLVWLRLTWAALLLPAVTGVILAVGGLKVASAVAAKPAELGDTCLKYAEKVGWAKDSLTRYCLPVDSHRDFDHLMYTAFCLLSLYLIEVLIKGRMIEHRTGLKFLPLVTLFLFGAAYMVGHVAVLPGNSVNH